MKEKLVIKNFGPIKDAEFEFSRFNVLIGEQATGKSTVAKLLAVCRYFSYIIGDRGIIHNNPFELGLRAWGLHEFVRNDTLISYSCKDYSFTAEVGQLPQGIWNEADDTITKFEGDHIFTSLKPLSSEFETLIAELLKIHESEPLFWKIPTSFFLNDVKRVMDNPFYLPTERGLQSVFSLGKNSLQNIDDTLFNYFAKNDSITKEFMSDTDIEPLGIVYKNENGRSLVRKHEDGKFFSLSNAASGYQSTIPVVLVAKYYSQIRKRKKTFIIEEPELNLFPSAQSELMKYLVENSVTFSNNIFITTHSPYTLASINNMIYAYQVGQANKEDVNEVLDEKYWLNPEDVSAYRLLPDGTYRNILDLELNQINVGELDGISRVVNEDWDKIANIEFSAGND